MNVRWNQAMLTLLGGGPEFLEPSSMPIPEELSRLLTAGFEEKGECILLRSLASTRTSALDYLQAKDDETGIEATINEIHVEDFVPAQVPLFELARLGCDFGFVLAKKLADERPSGSFRVIVAAMAAEPSSGNLRDYCTVRFHKRREGAAWLNDDLEAYREEAIKVLDIQIA